MLYVCYNFKGQRTSVVFRCQDFIKLAIFIITCKQSYELMLEEGVAPAAGVAQFDLLTVCLQSFTQLLCGRGLARRGCVAMLTVRVRWVWHAAANMNIH